MLNNINLADIRSFVLIAQLGNFTKAAEALGVSRSHVSRQISALESKMAVKLVTRTTRTLKLTLAGELLFKQCEGALNNIDQALIAAVDDTKQTRGLIRINCVGGYIGEQLIARYISEFMALYPQINIELDFSSHRVDLINDEFDIAFRMGEIADAGFVAKKLMNINIVTLASPAYIKAFGNPRHPKELSEHRCLTGSVKRWSFSCTANPSQLVDITIAGQLICKNGHALLQGALAGVGIIRVPKMYCEAQIANGELVELLPQWQIPAVTFSAIYHNDKYRPKRLREFINFINNRFEQYHQ
ncbi:LysR family transcriptional regulator [Pseudoalteromonas sp. MM1]|uniref:LysR family transcriptional regulator n=1 Tax=Pseudoalteromonas sp. MM1 TaxID=3036714 RepID=UPI0025727CEF|nr:LysR family transcriptional regulator [Pseudoalteromonas sp. MM1]BED89709.1 LysR family transcriptional regulator [Pseudoalteromonas sp. MM1]